MWAPAEKIVNIDIKILRSIKASILTKYEQCQEVKYSLSRYRIIPRFFLNIIVARIIFINVVIHRQTRSSEGEKNTSDAFLLLR